MCPNTMPPTDQSSKHQWDNINITRISNQLIFNSDMDKARYKASLCKEAGAWLTVFFFCLVKVLPPFWTTMPFGSQWPYVSAVTFVSLRDVIVAIGLTARYSWTFLYKQRWAVLLSSFLNNALKRTFNTAEFPTRLEPEGLCSSSLEL